MGRYDAALDHYCYSGIAVLKNTLNLQDPLLLEQAERDITDQTSADIVFQEPPYGLAYLQQLHRTLFWPLYDWAGEVRDVSIAKGNTRFCIPTRIQPECQKLFEALAKEHWLVGLSRADLCARLAEYYCEFNMIHPFREGNGRVQRLFFEHLSLSAGYELDWSWIQVDEWIQANIAGVDCNYAPMEALFQRILAAASFLEP